MGAVLRRGLRRACLAGAVLEFGAYDPSGQSPSGRMYAGQWFIQACAGHVADRTNPDVSPLYGDLRGLPPTLLIVGAQDILLEDSLAMAARLSAAGNEVDLRLFAESPHGFTSLPKAMATAALGSIESWLTAGWTSDRRLSHASGSLVSLSACSRRGPARRGECCLARHQRQMP
jgi:acetyl esterase/lipase